MKVLLYFVTMLTGHLASAALVYTPASFQPKTARVVVVIHGCLQSAEIMSLGTGWNAIAERENLAIIYPQVPAGSNPIHCWSWYLPENQRRDSGQLSFLMQEINTAVRRLRLRSPEIFVTGISSGAAMVSGLLACYPEAFKGGAVHSGPSYGLAQNLADGAGVLKDGPPAGNASPLPCEPSRFDGKLLVIQGLADQVVHPRNAMRVIADFSNARSRLLEVEGLGHAWAGYPPAPKRLSPPPPFFSEQGPDATQVMWNFFNEK